MGATARGLHGAKYLFWLKGQSSADPRPPSVSASRSP